MSDGRKLFGHWIFNTSDDETAETHGQSMDTWTYGHTYIYSVRAGLTYEENCAIAADWSVCSMGMNAPGGSNELCSPRPRSQF